MLGSLTHGQWGWVAHSGSLGQRAQVGIRGQWDSPALPSMRLLLWLPSPMKSELYKPKGPQQGLFQSCCCELPGQCPACSAGSVQLSWHLVSAFPAAGQSVVWCHRSPCMPPQARKIRKICPQCNFTLLLAHGNRYWITHCVCVCVCVSRWIIEILEALCIPPIWAQDTHFQDGNSLCL